MKLILLVCIYLSALTSFGQAGWQNKDLRSDFVFGMSTNKAYRELLAGKKSTPVVVAVIDGGVDTSHEDLIKVLWTNSKEKSNGNDDDGNGYADDFHGWNFIGSSRGNVHYDNLELTRLIRRDGSFFDSLSLGRVPLNWQKGFQQYRKEKHDFEQQSGIVLMNDNGITDWIQMLNNILKKINKSSPSLDDFIKFEPASDAEDNIKETVVSVMKTDPDFDNYLKGLADVAAHWNTMKQYQLNVKFDPRPIVDDNYTDSYQKYYGNNDIAGPDAHHGTHVAGIIAADRNNKLGIEGVADNVRLMCIRIVPDGDERDKDVANAIRYATDNGAAIINMSFGKIYSWDKKVVDDAVKYAMQKGVLLVHAAGNDGVDLDDPRNSFYPSKFYADQSGDARAWITVGASGKKDDNYIMAGFSNYGQSSVDVFAPGEEIYSCIPGSKYGYEQGTSMAAPMVTGLAALIKEYYPKLTAIEIKDIIMRSVVKRDALKERCVSGGVINVYNALILAKTYKSSKSK